MGATDDEINVQITSDVDNLVGGMDLVADTSERTWTDIEDGASAAGQALDESISGAAEKAKDKLEEVGNEAVNLGEKFDELKNSLHAAFEAGGILIAAEALHKLGEELEQATEHATQIVNMSDVLGISVEQFQALEGAANRAGVGMSMVTRTAVRLEEDFKKAAEGNDSMSLKLLNLGFTLEQINDKGFSSSDMIGTLAEHLRDGATATDTMSGITAAFGARAKMVAEALKEYDGSAEGVARAMDVLNGLTKEEAESLHKVHGAISDFSTDAGNAWAKSMLWAGGILEVLGAGERLAEDGSFHKAAAAQTEVVDAAKKAAADQVAAERSVKIAAVESTKETLAATKAGTAERLAAEVDYIQAVKNLYGTTGSTYKAALSQQSKDQREFADKQEADSVKAADADLRAYEKIVALKTEQTKKAAAEMSKDWDKYFKDLEKADKEALKQTEETVIAQTKAAEKVLDIQLKNKQIDPSTYLASERALIQQRLDFQIQYYEALKVLYVTDAAQRQQYENAEVKATQKAAQEMVDVQQKAAQQTKTTWNAAMKPIEHSFGSAIQTMVTSTHGFSASVKSSLDTVVKGAFSTQINAMVHQWLTGETEKTAGTMIANKMRVADTTAAATQTKAVNASTATTDIQTKAVQAAAGAYNAIVGIPYVGPILAIAAMAAAEAVVMGLIGKISSAEGGMVVGHDQLAMVHEDEMILPSNISQGINEKILGKNPFGESTGDSKSVGGNHYHFSALDQRSFDRYIKSQGARNSMVDAARKAQARGKTMGRHQ